MSALLPLKPGAEPQPRSGHRFQVAFQEPVSGGENPVQTRNGQADRKSARGQPAVLERDEFTFSHILRLRSSLRTRRM